MKQALLDTDTLSFFFRKKSDLLNWLITIWKLLDISTSA